MYLYNNKSIYIYNKNLYNMYNSNIKKLFKPGENHVHDNWQPKLVYPQQEMFMGGFCNQSSISI